MSISDAVAALKDFVAGQRPDRIRLAIGMAALDARVAAEPEGSSVFAQAMHMLREANDAADAQDVEHVARTRAQAVRVHDRLALKDVPVAGMLEHVDAAWRMVDLQSNRVLASLDEGVSARALAPDFHFLVVAMRRFRRSLALLVPYAPPAAEVKRLLAEFDDAMPYLPRLPDIGERLEGASANGTACELAIPEGTDGRRHVLQWGPWLVDVDLAWRCCARLRTRVIT